MLLRYVFGCLLIATPLYSQGVVQVGGRGRGPAGTSGARATPPAMDCAASGTVVNAITGEPIARAMVSIGGAGGSDMSGAATDNSGRWSITNAPCGTRVPTATRPGFIAMNQMLSATSARTNMIQLVSGSPASNIKIPLMPAGMIAGTVRDSNGDPLEQAQIRLMRSNVQLGKRTMINQGGTSSDLEGNFRFGNLMPGHYIVCASSNQITYPVGGGDALVFRESCYPGPVSSGLSNAMAVDAGREIRTSLTLAPTHGVRIRGKVSGAPEPAPNSPPNGPTGNVQLMTVPAGGGGKGAAISPDGTFEIRNVQPGSYVLRAMWRQQGPGVQPSAQTEIEVGSNDVDNIVMSFQPPGSLDGIVRYQLTQNGTATGGNPVLNVNLRQAAPGGVFFGPIPQAQWDANHTQFTFAGVPQGQFSLNANLSGAGGQYVKSATLRGQDVLNQGFSVEGKAGPVEVIVSDDVGSVDATVNNKDGHPVAASVLLLTRSGQRRILNSGDDGHVSAKNVPTGEYRAWAFDNINAVPYAEEDWMTRNAGAAEVVNVTSGGSAAVTLKMNIAPTD